MDEKIRLSAKRSSAPLVINQKLSRCNGCTINRRLYLHLTSNSKMTFFFRTVYVTIRILYFQWDPISPIFLNGTEFEIKTGFKYQRMVVTALHRNSSSAGSWSTFSYSSELWWKLYWVTLVIYEDASSNITALFMFLCLWTLWQSKPRWAACQSTLAIL